MNFLVRRIVRPWKILHAKAERNGKGERDTSQALLYTGSKQPCEEGISMLISQMRKRRPEEVKNTQGTRVLIQVQACCHPSSCFFPLPGCFSEKKAVEAELGWCPATH